ncbi:MAG: RNA polymerase sigma-70 factor [Cyclobacteriaceae bacterium]
MSLSQDTIAQLKSGDRKAFREIFEVFFQPLCAYGNRYASDPGEAEDLVQEVFIKLWERREDFDQVNPLKTFLYTSVRNACLNHLKHMSVRQKHEDALIYELESDHTFGNHVIEEETFNQLYTEIKQLPDSSQKVMLLALKGLKNKEIASTLSISENTVKTQKKIAYAKLKQKLSPGLNAILLSL